MPPEIGTSPENLSLDDIDPSAVYTVTELSRHIKDALAANPQFNSLLLKGEISNFSRAASGHIYFNLRDENCVIACAYFRRLQEAGCNDLGDGLQVVAMGSLTGYEPRSQYQLHVKKIIPIGDGLSAQRLKLLREKLESEGLFDPERKKPLPRLPRKVGIITSKDSAAITDILTVANSRCPNMNLVMAYATLQGDGAPGSIIRALNHLNSISDVDAIILARGGGPSEDFMTFNDESLVRAIASSSKPVITGIGHEQDNCLADLAADSRASTPTASAKAAIPDVQEIGGSLLPLKANLERSYKSYLLAIDAKEKEVRAKQEELQKLRTGLSSLSTNLSRSYDAYVLGLKIRASEAEISKKDKEMEIQAKREDLQKLRTGLSSLSTSLNRSYKSYLLAIDAKEKEVRAKQEELQKLRTGLSSLSTNLNRSYDAYVLGLKIRANEAEISKKDEDIKQAVEGVRSDFLKYKVAIVALVAFLVLIILIFLLRG